MSKNKLKEKSEVKSFLVDAKAVFALPVDQKYSKLVVNELPFDFQLLSLSSLYRRSRNLYLELGGTFLPRMCSTMRGLSAQDLFKDEIDYSPALSELLWFQEFGHQVSDAHDEITALLRFTEISIFHEQNHRVIWRLLPHVPHEPNEIYRYFNFAESLVVTLDLAFSDQLGRNLSNAFERMKMIYRPGGEDGYHKKSKSEYRKYLLALLTTTYYALETLHNDDILAAINYVLPGQKTINKVAVKRGLQLSELFTRVTNPQWQSIYWKMGYQKLKKLQVKSKKEVLLLPKDPLDLESEFQIALKVFDHFGL